MSDIEIALEDLDTLVEISRQCLTIGAWLGIVQSALVIKEALEKQKPMLVGEDDKFTDSPMCPKCYAEVFEGDSYCDNCGQKLDWE